MKQAQFQFMFSHKPIVLSHGEGCVGQGNNLSSSRCNFLPSCDQSELFNYFSVTVMMTLWSWCIQIMAEFSFHPPFLVFVRQILDEAATQTHEILLLSPCTLNKNPHSHSQTHITTSVQDNLPLCSLQQQMHRTVKDTAVNYLPCLCCVWWDEATSNE